MNQFVQNPEILKQQRVQQWKSYYMQQGYTPDDAQRQAMTVVYPLKQPMIPSNTSATPEAITAPMTIKNPSYAAVTKCTTSKPSPLPGKLKPTSSVFKDAPCDQAEQPKVTQEPWPESLKEYIVRAFSRCSPGDKATVEGKLKTLIMGQQTKSALNNTDWDKMDVPTAYTQVEIILKDSAPAKKDGSKNEMSKKETKKRKMVDAMDVDVSPVTYSPVTMVQTDEDDKREKRAKRFEQAHTEREKLKKKNAIISRKAQAAFIAGGQEGNPDVIDWDEYTIIGTCQQLEKRYLRLTSAPDPASVRPLQILRSTLELLKEKWKTEANYSYICDQFKSLRQDLTVQRVRNNFTVQVYEIHARIALEKGDVGEYNQCQAQLQQLYRLGLEGHIEEFIGYRILYMIFTMNKQDLNKTISSLTPEQKQNENIKHALSVRSCVTRGDYVNVFKLYHVSPDMNSYLMDKFLDRERVKAMKIMTRAYRPHLPLSFVAKTLGFCSPSSYTHGTSETGKSVDIITDMKKWKRGKKVCGKWLEGYGVIWSDLKLELIDTKATALIFTSKHVNMLQKIDIKGQI